MIPLLKKISKPYRRWQSERLLHRLSPRIPEIVKACPQLTAIAPAEQWKIQQVVPTLSDTQSFVIGLDDSPVTAILQISVSQRAITSFEHQTKVLAHLRADPRLSDQQRLLPHLLLERNDKDCSYWIFERLPGVNALTALDQANNPDGILQRVTEAIGVLHQRTADEITVDDRFLEQWVSAPIEVIRTSTLPYYQRQSHAFLNCLAQQLADSLIGRTIVTSWTHGDYWPGNILLSPEHDTVTGILDWDLAQPDGIPSLDLVNILASALRLEKRKELGEIVIDVYKQGTWPSGKQMLWQQTTQAFAGKLPELRDTLMIFWLWHLSANLLKSKRYSFNPIWARYNYGYVLDHL